MTAIFVWTFDGVMQAIFVVGLAMVGVMAAFGKVAECRKRRGVGK